MLLAFWLVGAALVGVVVAYVGALLLAGLVDDDDPELPQRCSFCGHLYAELGEPVRGRPACRACSRLRSR